jgi:hypothetical protein
VPAAGQQSGKDLPAQQPADQKPRKNDDSGADGPGSQRPLALQQKRPDLEPEVTNGKNHGKKLFVSEIVIFCPTVYHIWLVQGK